MLSLAVSQPPAFPAEAGTHLQTPEWWKAELALGGWHWVGPTLWQWVGCLLVDTTSCPRHYVFCGL